MYFESVEEQARIEGIISRIEFMAEEQGYSDIQELEEIEQSIEKRRRIIEKKIENLSPEALELLKHHREEIEEHLKEEHPELYGRMVEIRKSIEE